jgi:hypothetical protein
MLYRDDGRPLGMIMRYCEDAPTYAWVRSMQPETRARVSAAGDAGDRFVFKAKRLGACSTNQAARDAVERAHRGGTGIHTTR